MDNNKRTRLRSQALVSRSDPTTLLVPGNKDTPLHRTSGDIVEVEVEGEHDRGLPVVRGVNKRKRDPRGPPGGRRAQQKFESEEGSVSVYVEDGNGNYTASGDDVNRSPGDARFSRRADPDTKASPPEDHTTYVDIIPEMLAGDQAMMSQLSNDKRRESSRLRVKPSKFREGFLLGNNLKPKMEQKGASEDGSSSLEIVLSMDATHSNTMARADTHPKTSSSSDFTTSSFERAGQNSTANNNKFKITYKSGSSKGPDRRASAVVSSSTAKKAVDDTELKTALAVVKRVMQIKSAEPFNEPVDPIALEIPDYFDVIKEPMDLGTIRELLEAGKKYKTGLDVYADVQLVWNNCRSYNQEGDPIMDVLRIAETVFNKHWNAASLPVLPSTSKSSKAQKMAEDDEIESSDELVGDVEQGRRDNANRRQSKDTKVVAKLDVQKVVHFDAPNLRAKTRRSASVEQVMAESKAREDKVEVGVPEITTLDSNLSEENVEDEVVAEDQEAPEKVEDEEFQIMREEVEDIQEPDTVEEGVIQSAPEEVADIQAEGQEDEQEEIAMKDSEEERTEAEKPIEQEVTTPVQDADNTLRMSSSNKRRTFGTVHHKPECSCVVCVGRRRKLAREEKEGIVDGKKEGKKHKKSHRPVGSQDGSQGEKPNPSRVRKPPKLPEDQEVATENPTVAIEAEVVERNRSDSQMGNPSDVQGTVDPRYFPVTYELPLRKVSPSFLHLSKVLFGKHENNVWRRHHSLGCRVQPSLSTSSMFAAVHSLSLSER